MASAMDPSWEEEEEDEDEEEEIEEEQFVLVELSGIIDSDFLSKCENKCKILGIDTEKPILQVDSYVFAGEYEDTLGTCVIFEEGVERVDPEGTDKTVLKYKCHTMKKLSMTRTLLTEKKEGEENIDGVEWLQMKDNDFSYRPNMICSFLHENEDEAVAPAPEKAVELEDQEAQMKGSTEQTHEQERVQYLEAGDPGPLGDVPAEMGSSVSMGIQGGDISQNSQKPKTKRAKRFLEKREPKVSENIKNAMLIKGGNANATVTQVLRDMEFFSKKSDCSLFMFGSHNKKRPNNLIIGRMYDYHVLDMIELGIEKFVSLKDIKTSKCPEGTKPMLIFAGDDFDVTEDYRRLKNLLIDFFRGPTVSNVRLAGLEYVLHFTALNGKVYFRSYKILRVLSKRNLLTEFYRERRVSQPELEKKKKTKPTKSNLCCPYTH
ncbi:general transcription factor 3C polypeptide 6-like protein [Cricetulus griseus]|uniref:Ribosome production factor 2 homolog n=1 Tax=Cricetulus griseus TaxID=10029 RepID=A0A061IIU2_CRIGR|nr:general transcription factor 3C polypeptide 6-like protein [Cricetulus griseus]